jgi:cyanate lyase
MVCEPETELKNNLKKAGISYRDVSNRLGRKYVTVNNWLNGFSRLPDDARKQIIQMIEEKTGR